MALGDHEAEIQELAECIGQGIEDLQTTEEMDMTRFTINPDDTVTDTKTGLVWSRKTIAVNEDKDDADKALAALGEGWRYPTTDELLSLVDRTRHSPAIDTEAFPDTKNDCYWTSDVCAWNSSCFWVVYFCYGNVGDYHRYDFACVLPVRSVSASQ